MEAVNNDNKNIKHKDTQNIASSKKWTVEKRGFKKKNKKMNIDADSTAANTPQKGGQPNASRMRGA